MIEHVDRIEATGGIADQPVPIWLLNNRIDQINAAIDQINYHLETVNEMAARATTEGTG